MGCCIFRPITVVTKDPDVVMCTKVRGAAIISRYYRMDTNKSGLLYVKDNLLCYETVHFYWLDCKWLRRAWHVFEVKKVQAITPDSGTEIDYGLKIVMQSASGHTTTLVVETVMKVAIDFRTQLIQHIDSLQKAQKIDSKQKH